MKKLTTVNTGRNGTMFDIAIVEAQYNAKFVGQLCLRVQQGGWHGDEFGEVYWQETPPVKGYSHYFALIRQNGTTYITSGASAVEGIIDGILADDGEIVYSRYRHDMRYSTDKSVWIDGGRDYVRTSVGRRAVPMIIVDGEFYEIEPGDKEYDEEIERHR